MRQTVRGPASALASLTLFSLLSLISCRGTGPQANSRSGFPGLSDVREAPAEELESLAQMTERFDELQREVQDRNEELATLLKRYQLRGGQLPPNFGTDLTDEQRRLLGERIRQERLGLRSLLQDVLDRDREIQELRDQQTKLQQSLPESEEVQGGDRHEQIILGFLRRKGIPAAQARSLANQVNVQDPLVPGFRVWFYFDKEKRVFGTWVTQGSASLTPQEAQRRLRAAVEAERDAALSAADGLRGEVASLQEGKAALQRDVQTLQEEVDVILDHAEGLKRDATHARREAEAAKTGVRYLAGTPDQLRQRGVIGKSKYGPLKRLENMETLDLNGQGYVTLDPSVYGLDRIKKVTLLPDGLKRGSDYEVTYLEDGAFAKVSLFEPGRFRGATFVLVIE